MTSKSFATGGRPGAVDSPYAWFRLGICVLLATVGTIGMWATVVVLPIVQAEFGVDRATASLPFTLMMVGFALGNVIGGRYVDRAGIMLPVMGAALILCVGFVSSAFTTAIWQFAVIHGALVGLGTAIFFGPLITHISFWFNRRRGIAVAACASGNYVAGTVWPTLIRSVIDAEGWRTAYIGIGIMCIVMMVPLALFLRRALPPDESIVHDDASGGGTPKLAQQRVIDLSPRALQWLLVVAGVGCCVAMSMPQVHIVAYCVDLGYGVARGAEMLSLMLAGGIVSRLAFGFLADYIGGVRTLLLGSVLQCLALFFYLPFDGLMSLYVVSLIFGLAQGGIVPSYAIIVREYLPAREAGERIGLVIMATIGGMALGGWMSGWIYDVTGSYQAAFINGIGWNLLNISIMVMLLWRSQRPKAATA